LRREASERGRSRSGTNVCALRTRDARMQFPASWFRLRALARETVGRGTSRRLRRGFVDAPCRPDDRAVRTARLRVGGRPDGAIRPPDRGSKPSGNRVKFRYSCLIMARHTPSFSRISTGARTSRWPRCGVRGAGRPTARPQSASPCRGFAVRTEGPFPRSKRGADGGSRT
jgi:hypothetical protein